MSEHLFFTKLLIIGLFFVVAVPQLATSSQINCPTHIIESYDNLKTNLQYLGDETIIWTVIFDKIDDVETSIEKNECDNVTFLLEEIEVLIDLNKKQSEYPAHNLPHFDSPGAH